MAKKICIVGSGNWGSVIAKIVGLNVQGKAGSYEEAVPMYVYEEMIDGVPLTQIINTQHENVKYLPGCKLPNNVIAVADVVQCAEGADVLVFVLPHQFMTRICKQLEGKVKPTAIGVTLVKGLDVGTEGQLDLISNVIRRSLKIECAVLMGANVAPDVAREDFCEATIGCKDEALGRMLKEIFQTNYFRIVVVPDEETVELCGALKNVVAMGAGFIDGLKFGDNTKAAVIRLGLMEMIAFSKIYSPSSRIETFLESCGVADLITTCYSGRNRRVAEAFAANQGKKTIQDLEREMLNGQLLQGPPTAAEVNAVLAKQGTEAKFPIFTAVHRICTGVIPVSSFIDCIRNHPEHM
jgi:glycerol-3-phosphate dehydrogenase (NAD+)